jgi:hypothetical protein
MKYLIKVVKYRDVPSSEYIGRGSVLGNPFPIDKENNRNVVCDAYELHFSQQVESNPLFLEELCRLYKLGNSKGILELGCYCHPKRCHGDTIKRFLEDNVDLFLEICV